MSGKVASTRARRMTRIFGLPSDMLNSIPCAPGWSPERRTGLGRAPRLISKLPVPNHGWIRPCGRGDGPVNHGASICVLVTATTNCERFALARIQDDLWAAVSLCVSWNRILRARSNRRRAVGLAKTRRAADRVNWSSPKTALPPHETK